MNNGTSWQEANARYLAAAMAWLRACMEQLASRQQEKPPTAVLPVPQQPAEEPKSIWRRFGSRSHELPPRTSSLLLTGGTTRDNAEVANAAAAMQAAADTDPPPALLILAQRLGLSSFEQQLLILCLGMELDTGIAGLCARCQKDPARTHPTFALAFALFEGACWEALSPERPLRFWRLIDITQPGGQPLTTSALRADERIVNYAKGLNYLDDRLYPLVAPIEVATGAPDLPASHREIVDAMIGRLKLVDANRSLPVVQLLGTDSPSKQLVAAEGAHAVGLHLYRLPAILLPTQAADIETLTRLWQRESLLLPLALYIDTLAAGSEAGSPGQVSPVTRLLERIEGAVFLDTRESWPGLHKSSVTIDVSKPSSAEQAAAWHSALGLAAGDSPPQLAAQFNLGYLAIKQLAHEVLAEPNPQRDPLHARLWEACLASTRPQLDVLAERINPKATWSDIVLPATEAALLHHVAEQVAQRTTVYEKWGFAEKMSRGLGISALFAGDSGTGKTMAAEVIANDLQLNLYRIDLSAVVSKYIGETEKNLRRLFDAAENGGAILFFDEADALFGKRSEVKDSHDRYANIEINYLLQRMEAYRGLAILATNMKSALDTAFMRRLRFIVRFPFPGVAERKAIWQRVFPSDMPKATFDYDRLARLNITGGSIHSIALNAAFLAARARSALTMPLILDAARAEFRKLERPINEADFRWQEPAVQVA
jgi:ATPase family associated with various cellular activities (AAA)/Winged helix domain, variant